MASVVRDMNHVSDTEAQNLLSEMECPRCGAEIVEREEVDRYSSIGWNVWFECKGDPKHTYSSEDDTTGGRWALWDGWDE